MIADDILSSQLSRRNFFVEGQCSIEGECFLSANADISSHAHNRCSSLAAFDNICMGSFSGANCGFYKNVVIGAYSSFAEGVKIVPKVDSTRESGLTLSPCRNKDISPIFAGFKNQKLDQSYPLTIIGHDVWMGGNSQVQAGTIIGHGAVIGAGSVVKKHVPPYSIVVGNPARVLRLRFDKAMVERLLQSQWFIYDWQNIELPWGELEPCLELMEQHIAAKTVPTLGRGCRLFANEHGELAFELSSEQGEIVWTLEEHLQKLFGTSSMTEIFARPEVKAHSYA